MEIRSLPPWGTALLLDPQIEPGMCLGVGEGPGPTSCAPNTFQPQVERRCMDSPTSQSLRTLLLFLNLSVELSPSQLEIKCPKDSAFSLETSPYPTINGMIGKAQHSEGLTSSAKKMLRLTLGSEPNGTVFWVLPGKNKCCSSIGRKG